MSHVWVGMSHVWVGTSHVAHMDESCRTYKWVMSHIWTRRVAPMNESCHTYELVTWHTWMSHFTHMTATCHTYERVMCDIWGGYEYKPPSNYRSLFQNIVSFIGLFCKIDITKPICRTYASVVSYTWTRHVAHMNELCHESWMVCLCVGAKCAHRVAKPRRMIYLCQLTFAERTLYLVASLWKNCHCYSRCTTNWHK